MKKLLIMIMLLLFATGNFVAQNPNNHWQLGNSDVNFSTNPPTVSTAGNVNQYGNASISDDSGNLLFYTSGNNIWNKNHQIMQNSATINQYSAIEAEQPVIIVPFPSLKKYYIFWQQGDNLLCNCPDSDSHFYKYAIADFTTNPLGQLQVLDSYGSGSDVNNFYTRKLKGENSGTWIGDKIRRGGLTATKNFNNDGFWIIVNGGSDLSNYKLFSYKLTSSGLDEIPVVSYYSSQLTNNGTYSNESVFKFSPDNIKLGLLENNDYQASPWTVYRTTYFSTFTFDSTTGVFSNRKIVNLDNKNSYNFEFSNDSNKIYLASDNLYVKDLNNNSILPRIVSSLPVVPAPNPGLNAKPFKWHIQRDKNSDILLNANTLNFLNKVVNQDSFLSSSLATNYLSLNSNFLAANVLPQSIPQLTPQCLSNLVINSTIINSQDYRVSNLITASSAINNNLNVNFRAKQTILKPGFLVSGNATGKFRAFYDPCGTQPVFRNSIPDNNIENTKTVFEKPVNVIVISLNPSNGIFKISLNEISEGKIEVSDLYGFTIYKTDFKNQTDFEMNLQDRPKGIYVVKVFSGEQVFTSKIIKN